jgi:hypothetical protein
MFAKLFTIRSPIGETPVMPPSVYVSEDYCWSTEPQTFQWITDFLLERVTDEAAWDEIEASASFGWLFAGGLPEPGRTQVLRALAEDFSAAVVDGEDLPPAAGQANVLVLMAQDVLRRQAERTDQKDQKETGR